MARKETSKKKFISNEIITVVEFDAFMARLRAMVALANHDQRLVDLLARTVVAPVNGHPTPGTDDPAVSRRGRAPGPAQPEDDSEAEAGGVNPGPLTPRNLLHCLRRFPRGLLMRQLTTMFATGAIKMAREIKELRDAGLVVTTGHRSNTRYVASPDREHPTPRSPSVRP